MRAISAPLDVAKAAGFFGTVALVAAGIALAGARAPAPTGTPPCAVAHRDDGASVPATTVPTTKRSGPAGTAEKSAGAVTTTPRADRARAAQAAAPGPRKRAAPGTERTPSLGRGPLPPFPAGLPPFPGPGHATVGRTDNVLWLAGVVRGEPPLALLRRGDERYLVREGESVAGLYRVVRIREDSVVLRRGGRTITLRLGRS